MKCGCVIIVVAPRTLSILCCAGCMRWCVCTELPCAAVLRSKRQGVPGLQTSMINELNTTTHTFSHPEPVFVLYTHTLLQPHWLMTGCTFLLFLTTLRLIAQPSVLHYLHVVLLTIEKTFPKDSESSCQTCCLPKILKNPTTLKLSELRLIKTKISQYAGWNQAEKYILVHVFEFWFVCLF